MDKVYVQNIELNYCKYYNELTLVGESLTNVKATSDYKNISGTINIPADKLKDINLKEIEEYIIKEMR
ncbi:TPA: hypothetical protein LA742_001085 [Clostridium botulinum]|nr:hypothetical protein [Clostridium botulinum]